MAIKRCQWCSDDPLYREYHDNEWGVPEFDDKRLFEFLVLEGAQAGLSWITVLKKRVNYQLLFDQFDVDKVANYTDSKLEKLRQNPLIIRNKLKIHSARKNARACIVVQNEFDSFSNYLWGFVDGKPINNHWNTLSQVPTTTELSDKLSKDLKQRNFNFVGSTIVYAYMQAIGMVNDHTTDCFRYKSCAALATKAKTR